MSHLLYPLTSPPFYNTENMKMFWFRLYVGLSCHMAGCTPAVPWPTQGPSCKNFVCKCKGPFKRHALLTPSLSLPSAVLLKKQQASATFSAPPRPVLFSLPFPFHFSQIKSTIKLCICPSLTCVVLTRVVLTRHGMPQRSLSCCFITDRKRYSHTLLMVSISVLSSWNFLMFLCYNFCFFYSVSLTLSFLLMSPF